MANDKLDPKTRNEDIGVFIRKSRRVGTLPYTTGEIATMLKSTDGGDVITKNSRTGEVNIWNLEAGEMMLTVFDQVLAGATIDGEEEETSSTAMFWANTPSNLD